jgi:hypothetical protein
MPASAGMTGAQRRWVKLSGGWYHPIGHSS